MDLDRRRDGASEAAACGQPGIDLLWIPLGAGGRVVRISGQVYEALVALVQRRSRQALYHAALRVTTSTGSDVIELAPVPDRNGAARGVVGEGPVYSPLLGRLRIFRYEIRCWPGGTIPDAGYAVGGPRRVGHDDAQARQLLAQVPAVPRLAWGRDELGSGDMWNSNSVISWLLCTAGADVDSLAPPDYGRAPGWYAGIAAARALQSA